MKTLCEKLNDKKTRVFAEFYDSPQEFLRINDARECVYDADRDRLDPTYEGSDWDGVKTGADLRESFLVSRCDPSVIARARSSMRVKNTGTVSKRKVYRSVCGFTPIVPRAMMGLPDAMLNSRRELISYKILDVYIDVTAHAGVGADDLARAGQEVIEEVIGLELAGYRVGITAIFSADMTAYRTQDIAVGGVRIKAPSQPLNISRVIYPFVTPAFLRGVMFGWYQHCHDIQHVRGYGRATSNGPHRQEVANLIAGRHGIYLSVIDVIRGGRDGLHDRLREAVGKV